MRSIFVISDLHLGGTYPTPPETRGFRLCTHAEAIARFVQERTKEIAKNGPSEIVLNGDTVDFLAERDLAAGDIAQASTWSSFTVNPQAAVAKFKAIVERDKAVFDAFGPFLDAGGRLTVLLGNHDIELSLPDVRRELRKALGVKPGHDFEFIYDNEAYIVGDALIEHGNRYDAWNQIDYGALRRIRSLQSRNQPVPDQYAFVAPPGSDMVSRVMNTIKLDYAFVDLLKPETGAVVPMLLALEPGYRSRIVAVTRLIKRTRSHGLASAALPKIGDEIRADEKIDVITGGDIGSDSGPGGTFGGDMSATGAPPAARSEEDALLAEALNDALGGEAEASEFLRDIDAQMAEIDPMSALGQQISAWDIPNRIFGFAALLFGRTSQPYQKRLPALLKAIRGLQNSDPFEVSIESATEYLNAAQRLADEGGFRYVVFGHTHQAKHVPLGNGRYYFNSGTWADVLRFPIEILKSESEALKALECFVAQMRAGDFSAWTLFSPTYVRLDMGEDGKVANAELLPFEEATAP